MKRKDEILDEETYTLEMRTNGDNITGLEKELIFFIHVFPLITSRFLYSNSYI